MPSHFLPQHALPTQNQLTTLTKLDRIIQRILHPTRIFDFSHGFFIKFGIHSSTAVPNASNELLVNFS